MRIPFLKINNSTDSSLLVLAKRFDIVSETYPSKIMAFDNVNITDIQTYTDNERYNLDLFELNVDRAYSHSSNTQNDYNLVKLAKIQVMAVTFKFDLPVNFKLFNPYWSDFWRAKMDDYNIELIQPLVDSYTNVDISYFAFKSLFTSYMLKIKHFLNANHVICVKHDNTLVLAYGVENEDVYKARNEILDLFLDGIYEMIKVLSGRGLISVPEVSIKREIDVLTEYQNRKPKSKRHWFSHKK